MVLVAIFLKDLEQIISQNVTLLFYFSVRTTRIRDILKNDLLLDKDTCLMSIVGTLVLLSASSFDVRVHPALPPVRTIGRV